MAGIEFIDSGGLGVLIAAYKSDPEGSVRVTNPSKVVYRLLEVTGLRDIFLVE